MKIIRKCDFMDLIRLLNEKQVGALKQIKAPIKKNYNKSSLDELEMYIEDHAIVMGYDEESGDINELGILLESIIDIIGEGV